jgi:hypothetical protein
MLTAVLLALLQSAANAAMLPKPVANPRELLIEAIDAPDGTAHGVLTGELAEAIAQGFRTTAPLRIDVTTLTHYRQEGCRRLNVAFSQEGVHLPGEAAGTSRRIDVGIDFCRDGRPPSSRVEKES